MCKKLAANYWTLSLSRKIRTFCTFFEEAPKLFGPPVDTTTVKSDVRPAENRLNTASPTKSHIMANALAWYDLGVRSPYLQYNTA